MTVGEDFIGGSLSALEGRDGWLFLDHVDDLDVVKFYTNPDAVSAATLERWVRVLDRRRAYFAARGIAYQTFVPPDAHLVYRDKLPASVILAPKSPAERLLELLDDEARQQFVYPRAELIDGRAMEETYQSVDSHWTDWGAWLGYQASIDALAIMMPRIKKLDHKRVVWSEQQTFGSLGAIVSPERSAEVLVATIKNPASKQTVRIMTERRMAFLVVEQDAPDLPTAVVFRDSFMSAPGRFFTESFRRTVFVSAANAIFFDLIERERPDVVIHEMGERRLNMPPTEPTPEDFRFHFGDLMIDDPSAENDQRRSRSLLRDGRVVEALAANDAVLRRVPVNSRLLVHRAQLHLLSGQPQAAIEALRHALTLEPEDGAPLFLLGTVLDKLGRAEEAVEALSRAARAEPRLTEYWQMAISAALRANDLSAAEKLRTEAVEQHPDHAQLANASSWVLAVTGRNDEAEEAAQFAVRAEPESAAHLVQLAAVQLRGTKWAAASATVRDLRLLEPDHPAVEQYEEVLRIQSTQPSTALATEGSP